MDYLFCYDIATEEIDEDTLLRLRYGCHSLDCDTADDKDERDGRNFFGFIMCIFM